MADNDALRQRALAALDNPKASDAQKDAAKEIIRRLEGDKEVQFEGDLAAKGEVAPDAEPDPALAPPPFEGDPGSAVPSVEEAPPADRQARIDALKKKHGEVKPVGLRAPNSNEFHSSALDEDGPSSLGDWAKLHADKIGMGWLPEMVSAATLPYAPTHEIETPGGPLAPTYAAGSQYRDMERTLQGETEEAARRSPVADLLSSGTSMANMVAATMGMGGPAAMSTPRMVGTSAGMGGIMGAIQGAGDSKEEVYGNPDPEAQFRLAADAGEAGLMSGLLGGALGLAGSGLKGMGNRRLNEVQSEYGGGTNPEAWKRALREVPSPQPGKPLRLPAKPSVFARGGLTLPKHLKKLDDEARLLGVNNEDHVINQALPEIWTQMSDDIEDTLNVAAKLNAKSYGRPGMQKRVSLEPLSDDVEMLLHDLSDEYTGALPGSGAEKLHKYLAAFKRETEEMPLLEAVRVQEQSGISGKVVPVGMMDDVVEDAAAAGAKTVPGVRGRVSATAKTAPGVKSPKGKKPDVNADFEEVFTDAPSGNVIEHADNAVDAARPRAAAPAPAAPKGKFVYSAQVSGAKQLDDYKRMVDRRIDWAKKSGSTGEEEALKRVSVGLAELRDKHFGDIEVPAVSWEHEYFQGRPPTFRQVKEAEEHLLGGLGSRMEALTGNAATRKVVRSASSKQADIIRGALRQGEGGSAGDVVAQIGGAARLAAHDVQTHQAVKAVKAGRGPAAYMGPKGNVTMHANVVKMLDRVAGLSRMPKAVREATINAIMAKGFTADQELWFEGLAKMIDEGQGTLREKRMAHGVGSEAAAEMMLKFLPALMGLGPDSIHPEDK